MISLGMSARLCWKRHDLFAAEVHPTSRGLDGILSAIGLSADESNLLIMGEV